MGIKDLYKYLHVKYPELFKFMYYSEFIYKKIAIDMMNLLYVYKARDETNWLRNIIFFLNKLRKLKVHPVCVFDGKTHILKQDTVQKRRNDRQKGKQRVDDLKEALDHYIDTNEVNPSLEILLQKKTEFRSKLTSNILVTQIREYLNRQYKNYNIYFRTEELNNLKLLIESMGICVRNAENDAESFCSYLNRIGDVDIVLSNDSDVFFFGCKSVLCKFTDDGGFYLTLESILNVLELEYDEFIDFCILCGTDFNISVKGIGFVRGLNIIKKYKSLDNIQLIDPEVVSQVRHLAKQEYDERSTYSTSVSQDCLVQLFKMNINTDDIVWEPSEIIFVEE